MNYSSLCRSFILSLVATLFVYKLIEHMQSVERIEAKIDQILFCVDCYEEEFEQEESLEIKTEDLPLFKLPIQ
jgi:hypothetical protein